MFILSTVEYTKRRYSVLKWTSINKIYDFVDIYLLPGVMIIRIDRANVRLNINDCHLWGHSTLPLAAGQEYP